MENIKLYRGYWKTKQLNDIIIFVCGWAQYQQEVMCDEIFLGVISSIDFLDNDIFQKFVLELNGNFSIIISTPSDTIIAVDKMRYYPLIYFKSEGNYIITDDIIKFRKENKIRFSVDDNICEQYLSAGYVFGSNTIFKNIYSVQAGEIVSIDNINKSFKREQYFQWKPNMNNDLKRNLKDEAEKQDIVFINVFKRMIKSAPNVNNWIVPLSGGYDSRTIVNYFYKLGVKNVICFSFGIINNVEAKISREIAETLGYKWYFIDNPLEWISKIHKTNHLEDYLNYGFNGSSAGTTGDFLTVYALKEMGVIQRNDVFVPGHALDMIAGSHLDISMLSCVSVEGVVPIIKRHYSRFGYFTGKRSNVSDFVTSIINDYDLEFRQMAECFNWQERQTKFIANSIKCYEYFGFDSRIPEWDDELLRYWQEIGFNYRLDRNMFKEIFKQYLVIDILKTIPISNDLIQTKKKSFKFFLIDNTPSFVKKIMRRMGFIKKADDSFALQAQLLLPGSNVNFADYINNPMIPQSVKKYLKAYPRKQSLATLDSLDNISLINIKNSHN